MGVVVASAFAFGSLACGGATGEAPPADEAAPPASVPPTPSDVVPPPAAPVLQRKLLFQYAARATSAQVGADGSLVMTGYSEGTSRFGEVTVPDTGACANDYPYGSDLQATRLRLDGSLLSSWTLPGCFGEYTMAPDADGSVWVESATKVSRRYDSTESTPFLARVSADGQVLWQRRHPDMSGTYALQSARVRPGAWGRRLVRVAPQSSSPDYLHVELVRLAPDGEVEQAHDLGALEWLTTQLSVDARGYVTVAGELEDGGERFLFVERRTPEGEPLWVRRFPVRGSGGAHARVAPHALATAADGSTALLFDYSGELQLGSRLWRNGAAGSSLPLLVKLDVAGNVQWSAASSDSASWARLGMDAAGRPVVTGPRFSLAEPPPPPFQSFTHLSIYDAATGEPLLVEELKASVGSIVASPEGGVLVTGGLYVGGSLGTGDAAPGGFVLELSFR